MKMSVAAWTNVQNECFTDEPKSTAFRDIHHQELYYLIEKRTDGKVWSRDVGIDVTRVAFCGNLEPLVKAALERIDARRIAKEGVTQ